MNEKVRYKPKKRKREPKTFVNAYILLVHFFFYLVLSLWNLRSLPICAIWILILGRPFQSFHEMNVAHLHFLPFYCCASLFIPRFGQAFTAYSINNSFENNKISIPIAIGKIAHNLLLVNELRSGDGQSSYVQWWTIESRNNRNKRWTLRKSFEFEKVANSRSPEQKRNNYIFIYDFWQSTAFTDTMRALFHYVHL